jgi:hypothetical protein
VAFTPGNFRTISRAFLSYVTQMYFSGGCLGFFSAYYEVKDNMVFHHEGLPEE